MKILEAKNVTKIYGENAGAVYRALDSFDLEVEKGEFVVIMGPSGSGKTTLLQLLGTIDRPSAGQIWIDQEEVSQLNENQLADFRRKRLGFIFQDFHLLDALSLKENLILPMVLDKRPVDEIDRRCNQLAESLGIAEVLHHRPFEVSGGQKQRTAAARALIHRPSLILADEPTGNLDSKSAHSLMESLQRLKTKEAGTVVMVTHDPATASYADRVIFIKDGKAFQEVRSSGDRSHLYQQIIHVQTVLGGGEGIDIPTARF
ncbi:putative ABC transport system ATP-binding protein/putative ABC transport system ATP-binding protein [Seinonella peptonophila]|uniref:Putative ABC transport system ATP-binding protein/putative ABC transport system ATP-binding protein n=1 Tax=Seinonella peptonophila TaxID=112248 RepID=A0A1M4SQT7_9BACL|nr:ABC transporter ATP-binding protein [Seinonella peptonophila]SHE34535.1 putative ABC transport system ATP-binding protein/putative ABC transport system ATP-binding protein [Seinonella peptonophila]